MVKTEIVTGTLIDARTVALDKPLEHHPMKVRVAIEALEDKRRRCYRPDVIAEIHAAQAARGHKPRSRAEVDQAVQSERDSWGD